MKSFFVALCLLIISYPMFGQNVGINTSSPIKTLSVNGSIVVDQNNMNNGSIDSAALLFGPNGTGIFSNKNLSVTNYNGIDYWTAYTRRMVITSSGLVGINLGSSGPTALLDVNGPVRSRSSLTVDNNSTINGSESVGGDVAVAGNVSVGGKGIVKSNTATNLRMGFTSGSYTITLPSGVTTDILFNITPFAGSNNNIRVSICQFVTNAGSNDTWGRITMTVHSVDEVANQCKIRFFNGSAASATMAGTLYLMSVATD